MPRSILCFQDAESLLRVQEDRIEDQTHDIFPESTSKVAILTAQRLCKNASIVALACGFFEADTHFRFPGELSTTQL